MTIRWRELLKRELALLREGPQVRRFVLAVFLFDLSYWVHLTAFPILAYQLSGRASAIALAMTLHCSTALLLIAFGGWVFRSLAREEVCRKACLALSVVSAIVLTLSPLRSAARLYPYVALFSLLNQFHSPASFSLIPAMAGESRPMKTLNSARSIAFIAASLLGPLAVSLLTSRGVLGRYPVVIMALTSCAYVLYGDVGRWLRAQGRRPLPQRGLAALAWPSGIVRFHLVVWFFFSLSLAFDPMMVVFVRQFLARPDADVGLILALCGLASIVGSALISTFERSESLAWLAAYYLLTGLGLGLFGLFRQFPVSLLIAAVIGVGYGLLYTAFHSRLQASVSDEALPRAYVSVQATQVAGSLLSVLASKLLLPLMTINGIYASYGLVFVLGSAYIYSARPRTAS